MTDRNHWFIVMQLLAAILAFAETRPASATFTNVTAAAGINYAVNNMPAPEIPILEFYTGGAAAGDFDNDGWVDLYVTRYYAPDILYRNNHNGTFSDATGAAFGGLADS